MIIPRAVGRDMTQTELNRPPCCPSNHTACFNYCLSVRRYRLTSLLVEGAAVIGDVLKPHMGAFIGHLMRAFEPTSQGSYFHVSIVLQRLLAIDPDEVAPVFGTYSAGGKGPDML